MDELENDALPLLLILDENLFPQFLEWSGTLGWSDLVLFILESDHLRFISSENVSSEMEKMKFRQPFHLIWKNSNGCFSRLIPKERLESLERLAESQIPMNSAFSSICDAVWNELLSKGRQIANSAMWNSVRRFIVDSQEVNLANVLDNAFRRKYFERYLQADAADLACLHCYLGVKRILEQLSSIAKVKSSNSTSSIIDNNNNGESEESKKSSNFMKRWRTSSTTAAVKGANKALQTGSGSLTNSSSHTSGNTHIQKEYSDPFEAFKIALEGTRSLQKQFFPASSTNSSIAVSGIGNPIMNFIAKNTPTATASNNSSVPLPPHINTGYNNSNSSSMTPTNNRRMTNNSVVNVGINCSGLSEPLRMELAATLSLNASVRTKDIETVDQAFAFACANTLERLLTSLETETFQYVTTKYHQFEQSTEYANMIATIKCHDNKTILKYSERLEFLNHRVRMQKLIPWTDPETNGKLYISYIERNSPRYNNSNNTRGYHDGSGNDHIDNDDELAGLGCDNNSNVHDTPVNYNSQYIHQANATPNTNHLPPMHPHTTFSPSNSNKGAPSYPNIVMTPPSQSNSRAGSRVSSRAPSRTNSGTGSNFKGSSNAGGSPRNGSPRSGSPRPGTPTNELRLSDHSNTNSGSRRDGYVRQNSNASMTSNSNSINHHHGNNNDSFYKKRNASNRSLLEDSNSHNNNGRIGSQSNLLLHPATLQDPVKFRTNVFAASMEFYVPENCYISHDNVTTLTSQIHIWTNSGDDIRINRMINNNMKNYENNNGGGGNYSENNNNNYGSNSHSGKSSHNNQKARNALNRSDDDDDDDVDSETSSIYGEEIDNALETDNSINFDKLLGTNTSYNAKEHKNNNNNNYNSNGSNNNNGKKNTKNKPSYSNTFDMTALNLDILSDAFEKHLFNKSISAVENNLSIKQLICNLLFSLMSVRDSAPNRFDAPFEESFTFMSNSKGIYNLNSLIFKDILNINSEQNIPEYNASFMDPHGVFLENTFDDHILHSSFNQFHPNTIYNVSVCINCILISGEEQSQLFTQHYNEEYHLGLPQIIYKHRVNVGISFAPVQPKHSMLSILQNISYQAFQQTAFQHISKKRSNNRLSSKDLLSFVSVKNLKYSDYYHQSIMDANKERFQYQNKNTINDYMLNTYQIETLYDLYLGNQAIIPDEGGIIPLDNNNHNNDDYGGIIENNNHVIQLTELNSFPITKHLGICDFSLVGVLSNITTRLLLQILMLLIADKSVVLISSSSNFLMKMIVALPRFLWPFRIEDSHSVVQIINGAALESFVSLNDANGKTTDSSNGDGSSNNEKKLQRSDTSFSKILRRLQSGISPRMFSTGGGNEKEKEKEGMFGNLGTLQSNRDQNMRIVDLDPEQYNSSNIYNENNASTYQINDDVLEYEQQQQRQHNNRKRDPTSPRAKLKYHNKSLIVTMDARTFHHTSTEAKDKLYSMKYKDDGFTFFDLDAFCILKSPKTSNKTKLSDENIFKMANFDILRELLTVISSLIEDFNNTIKYNVTSDSNNKLSTQDMINLTYNSNCEIEKAFYVFWSELILRAIPRNIYHYAQPKVLSCDIRKMLIELSSNMSVSMNTLDEEFSHKNIYYNPQKKQQMMSELEKNNEYYMKLHQNIPVQEFIKLYYSDSGNNSSNSNNSNGSRSPTNQQYQQQQAGAGIIVGGGGIETTNIFQVFYKEVIVENSPVFLQLLRRHYKILEDWSF